MTLSRLARALSVKPSSALKVVRELEAEGLVTYGGRKGLHLTEAGRRRVEELNQRHKTLEEFFLLIGLTPEEAFREAEKLEHVISPEVVRRIAKLNEALKKMRGSSRRRRSIGPSQLRRLCPPGRLPSPLSPAYASSTAPPP